MDSERIRTGWHIWMTGLITFIALVLLTTFRADGIKAQEPDFSLRFYGHGVDDIGRVKIPIDPSVPADVGATDFTLEFWMKANAAENAAGAVSCGALPNEQLLLCS